MSLQSPMLLFLEFNEINFDFVESYCATGQLPNFARVLRENGLQRTTSESSYELLEPWIQWVTAHTGKTFDEHRVFRLGDIVSHDLPQIWEQLEARGMRVGAISPMNAKHRLRNPAFFVPDPWTKTAVTAEPALRKLHNAIAQAVNENATRRISIESLTGLLAGFLRYSAFSNWGKYFGWATTTPWRRWRGALLLDQLLADVFVREVLRTKPNFASLFLNAGAHIQHHYMFSSKVYSGPHRNPEWYISPGIDPVLEVYRLYDTILGAVRRVFPLARVMVATGLHQQPFGHLKFYWRLRSHSDFLAKLGVRFVRVEPLMSRDFLVVCQDEAEAAATAFTLASVLAPDGTPIFEVDNRGKDLFVMLTYPHDIPSDSVIRLGSVSVPFREEVAFVAIKNGEHDGIGYFIDTQCPAKPTDAPFALASMPMIVTDALLGSAISKGSTKAG